MKKLLYFAMAIVTSLTFIACGDDNDGTSVSTNPQVDAAGTYSGTWTINIVKKTTPVGSATTTEVLYDGTNEGSIVLTAASQYVVDVEFVSDVLKQYMGDPLKGKLNIAQTTNGYTIYNFNAVTSADNGIIGKGYGGSITSTNNLVINKFERSDKETTEVQIGVDRRGRPIMKSAEIETSYVLSFSGAKKTVE